MNKAFSTLTCLGESFEGIIALCKRADYRYVELRLCDEDMAAINDFSAVKELFEDAGIVITDIASSIFIVDGNIKDIYYKYIDLASAMGVKGVRIFGGKSTKYYQDELVSDVDGMVEALGRLCRYALDKNVELWLETHSEFSTGKRCKMLLERVNMPNLKVLWDVIHSMEYCEELDDTIAAIGDDLVHVHFKDGYRAEEPGLTQFVHSDLLEGEMQFGVVIEKLKKSGFDGCLSLEWEAPWRPELRSLYDDNVVLLKKYADILKQYGVE